MTVTPHGNKAGSISRINLFKFAIGMFVEAIWVVHIN